MPDNTLNLDALTESFRSILNQNPMNCERA